MTSDTQGKSLPVIAMLNVLFMLIVLFLHHHLYTSYFIDHTPNYAPLRSFLMYFSVGGFIFFAAYKLSKSKLQDSPSKFWLNRLARIYPLYALAILTSYLLIEVGAPLSSLIKHLLGLQIILPKTFGGIYGTLYFIGLLFTYYALFSLFRTRITRPVTFLCLSAALFIGALILRSVLADQITLFIRYFFIYYPMFIVGLLIGHFEERLWPLLRQYSKFLIPLSLAFFSFHILLLVFVPPSHSYHIAITTITVSITIIPLFLRFIIGGRSLQAIPKKVWAISYASYAVFLFHGPIWHLMNELYPNDGSLIHLIYIVLLGTFVIIVVGYSIQSLYDRARRKVSVNLAPKIST